MLTVSRDLVEILGFALIIAGVIAVAVLAGGWPAGVAVGAILAGGGLLALSWLARPSAKAQDDEEARP